MQRRVHWVAFLLATGMLGMPSIGWTSEALSVEDSCALLYARRELPIHVYAQAHPSIRPVLLMVLESPEHRTMHAPALKMLGFVGNETDVPVFKESLRRFPSGVLVPSDSDKLYAILKGLGAMCYRHVRGAEEALAEMCNLDFWKKTRFRLYKPGTPGVLPSEIETLVAALRAYAPSAKEKLDPLIKATLASTASEPYSQQLQPKLQADVLKEQMEHDEKALVQPVSENERIFLKNIFKDMGGQLPLPAVLSEQESQFARASIEEARKAFDQIEEQILSNNYTHAWSRLLDDGERVAVRLDRVSEEYREGLADRLRLQGQILSDLRIRHCSPVRTLIEHDVQYRTLSDAEGGGVLRSEQIVVRFKMSDSNRWSSLSREKAGGRTVGMDGFLYVVMTKIGPTWHWTPFGWENVVGTNAVRP